MSCKTAFIILCTSCIVVSFSGCQAGKLNMQQLAFWKKNDTLDSRYIEPPSHQLTPSDTRVAGNSDDSNLPPLPPDINRTADKFESEVTKSYQELAQQTKESENRFANSLADAEQKTRSAINEKLPSRSSYSSGLDNVAEPNFNNPLTPKPINRNRPNTQIAQRSVDAMPPSSGSFRPRPTSAKSSPTISNAGMTEYEKLAQLDSGQLKPSTSGELPKINYPTSNSPLKPNNQLAQNSQSIQNPYSTTRPKSDRSLQAVTGASQATQANQSLPSPSGSSRQVNYEYPSTPYQPYNVKSQDSNLATTNTLNPSSHTTSPLKPNNSITSPSMTSSSTMKLDISGQGSYAPGSIRRPKALLPSNLKLPYSGKTISRTKALNPGELKLAPASSAANTNDQSGGAFKR